MSFSFVEQKMFTKIAQTLGCYRLSYDMEAKIYVDERQEIAYMTGALIRPVIHILPPSPPQEEIAGTLGARDMERNFVFSYCGKSKYVLSGNFGLHVAFEIATPSGLPTRKPKEVVDYGPLIVRHAPPMDIEAAIADHTRVTDLVGRAPDRELLRHFENSYVFALGKTSLKFQQK